MLVDPHVTACCCSSRFASRIKSGRAVMLHLTFQPSTDAAGAAETYPACLNILVDLHV
jgi:hypothetical protein